MTIAAGKLLGPYQIVVQTGAGGIGEVDALWRRLSRQPKFRAERGISHA